MPRRTLRRTPLETLPVGAEDAGSGSVDDRVADRIGARSAALVFLDAERFVELASRMQIPASDAIRAAINNVELRLDTAPGARDGQIAPYGAGADLG